MIVICELIILDYHKESYTAADVKQNKINLYLLLPTV